MGELEDQEQVMEDKIRLVGENWEEKCKLEERSILTEDGMIL
jgi:hypothetical protein